MNLLNMAPALYTELNHLGLYDDFFYSQADQKTSNIYTTANYFATTHRKLAELMIVNPFLPAVTKNV